MTIALFMRNGHVLYFFCYKLSHGLEGRMDCNILHKTLTEKYHISTTKSSEQIVHLEPKLVSTFVVPLMEYHKHQIGLSLQLQKSLEVLFLMQLHSCE